MNLTGFKKWWNGQGWAFIADNELREHGKSCAKLAWDEQEKKLAIAVEALEKYAADDYPVLNPQAAAVEALKQIEASK